MRWVGSQVTKSSCQLANNCIYSPWIELKIYAAVKLDPSKHLLYFTFKSTVDDLNSILK